MIENILSVLMATACVCQYVGMYENEEFGGMQGTLSSLIKADPDFGEATL